MLLASDALINIGSDPQPVYDELAVRRERRALDRMEAARRAWLSGHPSAAGSMSAVDVASLVEDR